MFVLVLLLCLLVGSVMVAVVLQNSTLVVHLSLFIWQTPGLPVGLLLVGAFLLGAFLLYVISVGAAWRDRREIRHLRRRLAALEQNNEQDRVPVMVRQARAQEAVVPAWAGSK